MAKGTSFSDKSKGKKGKDQVFVKYVKSVQSEKTGHWRFNEQIITLDSGENLDGALKRIEEETLALDMELPSTVEETVEAKSDQEQDFGSPTEEVEVAEAVEEAAEEDASIEEIAEESTIEEDEKKTEDADS